MTLHERIQQDAEAMYPLADARKVLCHDNQGQLSRQDAYSKGALTERLKVLEEMKEIVDKYYHPPIAAKVKEIIDAFKE